MDDYMFEEHVKNTVSVVETTTYVEIFQYTVPLTRYFLKNGLDN